MNLNCYPLQAMTVLLAVMSTAAARKHVLPTYSDIERLEPEISLCLNTPKHKEIATGEHYLKEHCSPWKSKSCCNESIAAAAHEPNGLYNFDYDHCSHRSGRRLSQQCLSWFQRDFCFYLCEPHIANWVVPREGNWATERFLGIPLCPLDCSNWWDACKEEFTCVKNWITDFKWRTQELTGLHMNHCPPDSACRRFRDIYADSTDFCQVVWNTTYRVTGPGEPCIRLHFDPEQDNPNRVVAAYYYLNEKVRSGATASGSLSILQVLNLLFSCLMTAFILF